jgi:hypothetical protein
LISPFQVCVTELASGWKRKCDRALEVQKKQEMTQKVKLHVSTALCNCEKYVDEEACDWTCRACHRQMHQACLAKGEVMCNACITPPSRITCSVPEQVVRGGGVIHASADEVLPQASEGGVLGVSHRAPGPGAAPKSDAAAFVMDCTPTPIDATCTPVKKLGRPLGSVGKLSYVDLPPPSLTKDELERL